jgi:lipopolysaccharide export system protein LptA
MSIASCARTVMTIVVLCCASVAAHAQAGQGTSNVLQGLTQNRDKPVQIRAQTFEVRDKERTATFSGNVQVVQGDTTIRCKSLIVTYETEGGGGLRAAQPGPGGRSQISKLEARGGVIVTQKDQTATGDSGLFDLKTNIITLTGYVVISQGGNVMRGDRMVVNLNSGVSRIESGKSNAPVRGMFQQSPSDAAKPSAPGAPGAMPRLDMLRPGQQN